jgi:very-short-patch-repair endonuclease
MLEQARDGHARNIGAFEAALNRAASKSVDFVIVGHAGGVVLVIELDNRSHDRPDRMRRDQEVRAVLAHCGVLLVRVRPGQQVDVGRHLLARMPGLVD